jgi:hypothetical protein
MARLRTKTVAEMKRDVAAARRATAADKADAERKAQVAKAEKRARK